MESSPSERREEDEKRELSRHKRLHNSFEHLVEEAIKYGEFHLSSSVFDLLDWSKKRTY